MPGPSDDRGDPAPRLVRMTRRTTPEPGQRPGLHPRALLWVRERQLSGLLAFLVHGNHIREKHPFAIRAEPALPPHPRVAFPVADGSYQPKARHGDRLKRFIAE